MDSNSSSIKPKSSFLLKSACLSSSSLSSSNSELDSSAQNPQLQNLKYNQKRLSLKTQGKGIEVNHNSSSMLINPEMEQDFPKLSRTTSESCSARDVVSASRVDIFEENAVEEQPILTTTITMTKEIEESNTTTATTLTVENSRRRSHSDSNSSVIAKDAKKQKLQETDDHNKTEQVNFLTNVQLQCFDKDNQHDDKDSLPSNYEPSTKGNNNNFNLELNPKNRYASPKVLKDIEFMMNEMTKENPDLVLIDKKMDATFRYRKTEIDTFGTPIFPILKYFPALKNWKILKSEFDRVQRKNINFRQLEKKLKQVLEENYLKFRDEGFSCNSILPKVNEEDLQNNNKDLLQDVMTFAFLFMKSNKTYLDGKLFKIREVHQAPFFHQFGTPTIDVKGHFLSNVKISVYCEGSKFCETPTFYEAVLCSYAIHWLFNLEYEKSCAQVFNTLDSLWRK